MSTKPTILISGASRGLGAETAVAAARLGANLLLTARSRTGLQNTAARVADLGYDIEVSICPGDLSEPSFCAELVDRAREQGALEAVVLNAARIDPIGSVEHLDEEEWLQCVTLNLAAPFRLAKNLLPVLAENQGRLIAVGTGAATQPIPSWSAYCASKAALLMLMRVIAAEKPEVTVFSFGPGVVNTAMQQTIRERKESMPAQLAEYFSSLHKTGQLEPPEVPGRALAWCAMHAPREWSGTEILYSDPRLVERVRAAFAPPKT